MAFFLGRAMTLGQLVQFVTEFYAVIHRFKRSDVMSVLHLLIVGSFTDRHKALTLYIVRSWYSSSTFCGWRESRRVLEMVMMLIFIQPTPIFTCRLGVKEQCNEEIVHLVNLLAR